MDEQICDNQDCKVEFTSRPGYGDRFCLCHQLEWDAHYDDHVDPQHAYHQHGPEGDFVPEH